MTKIPLFVLDVVAFPGGEAILHIFEPRYRKLINRCMSEPRPFGIVRAKDGAVGEIGCEMVVAKVLRRYPDGRMEVRVRGVDRIRVRDVTAHEDGYLEAEWSAVTEGPEDADHALEDRLEEKYRAYAALAEDVENDPPPRGPRWSFRVAERLELPVVSRQELLETLGENDRLRWLDERLDHLILDLRVRQEAQSLIRGNGRMKRPS